MLASLAHAEYDHPTPVQAGLIPRAMAGADILGQARTGTGKTAAFAIPILESLEPHKRGGAPQALILTPTRELAVQVRDEIDKLAYGRRVASVTLHGGKPIRGQIAKLNRGIDIAVGTPGRLLDHLGRGSLDTQNLRTVVLDEADRMLDIGFRPDIEKILRHCPQNRQTMLLSATVPPSVQRLARRYMREPILLDFSTESKASDTIDQYYFTVDAERKVALLVRLLEREQPEQAIVFCRTRRGTDRLCRKLSTKFRAMDCIHGDMQQGNRDRVMRQFRSKEVRILIATDVVGRGIDVTGISHIINFDIPQSSDDYVHRVGRTGRMGRQGVAYSFVTPEEGEELTRIEMLINKLLKRGEIEGFQTVAPVIRTTTDLGDRSKPDSETPEPPKPAPPGQRPRRRHRRGL